MKVLAPGSSDDPFYARLVEALPGFEVDAINGREISEACQGVDVLVAYGGKWNREVLEKLPISFLQRFGVGVDNVDLEAADDLGIWVANVPSLPSDNADSVADLALLLTLSVYRRTWELSEAIRTGNWHTASGRTLKGKTACLVGMGGIGLCTGLRLKACGMKLVAVRKNTHKTIPEELVVEEVYGHDRLHEALSRSDCVILSATTDENTRGMMGEAEFAVMPKGSVFVNVGRGALVDHDALYEALAGGHLAGAGLDVFEREPLEPSHRLFTLPNLVGTPHIAGSTEEALHGIGEYLIDNIREFAAGKRAASVVNAPPTPRRPLH